MKGINHRSTIAKSIFLQNDSAEYHLYKNRFYWPLIFIILLIFSLLGVHYSDTLRRIGVSQMVDNIHMGYLQSYSQYLISDDQSLENLLVMNPMELLSVFPANYLGEVKFYSVFKNILLKNTRGWDKVWVFEPSQRLLVYFEMSCSQFFLAENCNNEIIVTTLSLEYRSSTHKKSQSGSLVDMAEKILSKKTIAVFEFDYTVTKMVISS